MIADQKTSSASVTTDPFDSYSILRPEDDLFRLSSPKAAPAFFAAGLAVVLIAITIAYPRQPINSAAGMMDTATRASDAAVLPATKSEIGRSNVTKTGSSSSAGAIKRPTESPKRGAQASRKVKSSTPKPPPYSIAP